MAMATNHATTNEPTIVKLDAASRVVRIWGLLIAPVFGYLVLTPGVLRFEPSWFDSPPGWKHASRDVDIPLESIVTVTTRRWPSTLRLLPQLLWFALWPGWLRTYQANLAIETRTGTHRFRVREPDDWVQALRPR